jgi:hypothetical protein
MSKPLSISDFEKSNYSNDYSHHLRPVYGIFIPSGIFLYTVANSTIPYSRPLSWSSSIGTGRCFLILCTFVIEAPLTLVKFCGLLAEVISNMGSAWEGFGVGPEMQIVLAVLIFVFGLLEGILNWYVVRLENRVQSGADQWV